jgi:AcrR family transcriptional regulator
LTAFVTGEGEPSETEGFGPALLDQVLSGAVEELDLTSERILDAALDQFEREGIRRSSVESVAQRAGVTRVTVYRRFPRKEALVSAVVVREVRRTIAEVDARTAPIADAEERTVEGFVVLLDRVRSHPLTQRLLAVEPEEILRVLTVDAGPVLALGTAYVATQIRRGQREGAFPAYDPEPVAEILARLAHSLLLTPKAVVELDDEAEARAFAREYLTPILARGR